VCSIFGMHVPDLRRLHVIANALNASASIFEAKSDIDTKFGKIADKECYAISTDVKKWFRTLAVCLCCPCNFVD
jgi:hypothetical protein